jgi:glycosyltransferase involved in cell wall biosynthesis
MTPTIAVVIPNRNDSKYLKKCLASVLNQKIPHDEIIVVDDQSTDNSLEVIRNELLAVPAVKIIENSVCMGSMGAANEGLKHITSDYVLFLSANDYLESGIFERAKSCIMAADYPGVWSAMVRVVDEAGHNLRLYPTPVIALRDAFFPPEQCVRLAMTTGHWFTGTTLIYHRETLQKIGGFDRDYEGLADLMAALTVASIKGASFSPEPFGVMRQHDGGLMWRTLTNLPLLDLILEKMANEGPKLSPALFTQDFCELFQRRIRFTAIRAFHTNNWQVHVPLWKGYRYRLLSVISPFLNWNRKLQLASAFLILRPFADVVTIVWYRIFGTLVARVRLLK